LKEAGAETVALDVTSPLSELEKIAKEANAKYGYINHLVNAAGYILVGAVEETSYVLSINWRHHTDELQSKRGLRYFQY
jgi:short-subunit dehydrogenase